LWQLPVIYVVENNLYGASTPVDMVVRTEKISDRASIYEIPGVTVDGNDPLAVYEASKEATDRARQGKGPTLLELITYRITGHSRRDPCNYQPKEERQKAKENEPIGRFEKLLISEKVATEAEIEEIQKDIEQQIEDSIVSAQEAELPKPEDALEDLFVEKI